MANEKKAIAKMHADIFTDERMVLLALVAVVLFFVEMIVALPPFEVMVIIAIDWFVWFAFLADFTLKLYCATTPIAYARSKPLDFCVDAIIVLSPLALILTPFEQEAFLSPVLRVMRFERLVRIVRVAAYVPLVIAGLDKISASFYKHRFYHYLTFTILSIMLCSALVFSFEKGKTQSFVTYEDALWWAVITTATTASPFVPSTAEGRIVASYLVLVGIGFLAMLTANIAAYFVESQQVHKPHKDELEIIDRKLDKVMRLLEKRK